MKFLREIHIEDNHRGISSLRNLLREKLIYFEGMTFLSDLTVKNCELCAKKNKAIFKREPCGQIVTSYPKQRYIMDITELPEEFNDKNKLYLFNIIDHFSKFGMSHIIQDKRAETIVEKLKISFESYGFPDEIGSDKESEFKNTLVENFLVKHNIKFIHGNPYNPHSQGVVERFHQTLKDLLFSYYFNETNKLNLKDSLNIVLLKYNNYKHNATLMNPNEIFFSYSNELFDTVLHNIKKSFKNVGIDFNNFKEKEKILLNPKFLFKKKYNNKKPGTLIFNKIKHKKIYLKIVSTVVKKSGSNYLIEINKDYPNYELKSGDQYYVNYKLIKKCSLESWKKILNEKVVSKKKLDLDEIIDNNDIIEDNEENFINLNQNEFN